MPERIVIEIDEEGNPTIKVEGVAGISCKSLTKGLEKALGKVTEDKKTADFCLPEAQVKQQVRR